MLTALCRIQINKAKTGGNNISGFFMSKYLLMMYCKIKFLLAIILFSNLIALSQPQGRIYFTDASYNYIFRLEGNKIDTVISTGLGFPWRLAAAGDNLYWTSVDTNLVEKADMDGSNRRELAVITYPEGIAVNPITHDIYISEAGTPAIIKLAPPNYIHDTLYTDGLRDPDNILYHSALNKLFWVDVGLGQIIEAGTDGDAIKILLDNTDYDPQAIAIDRAGSSIYWTDLKKKGICSLDIATREVEVLISDLIRPTALSLDEENSTLIWLDVGSKSIGWMKLDGNTVNKMKIEQLSDFHSGLLVLPGLLNSTD